MLVCPNCKNEQEIGKFCGKCGTETVVGVEQVEQQVTETKEANSQVSVSTQSAPEAIDHHQTAAAIEQPNINTQEKVEATKQVLGQYWNHFLHLLKNPSRGFTLNTNHFIYGLVTMGIYAIAFSLSLYFFVQSYLSNIPFSGMLVDLSFFKTNFNLIISIIIFIAVAFFSAFIVIKIAKSSLDFKTLVAQFGGLLIPFVALNVVAILGALIKSTVITLIPLFISSGFVFIYLPVVFAYEKVNQINSQGQKIYFSMMTVALMIVFSLILTEVVISKLIGDLTDQLPNFIF